MRQELKISRFRFRQMLVQTTSALVQVRLRITHHTNLVDGLAIHRLANFISQRSLLISALCRIRFSKITYSITKLGPSEVKINRNRRMSKTATVHHGTFDWQTKDQPSNKNISSIIYCSQPSSEIVHNTMGTHSFQWVPNQHRSREQNEHFRCKKL